MRCPRCDVDTPEGAKFCIECGTPLRARCHQCGADMLPQAKFCGECGTPLSGQPTAPPTSHPLLPASYTPSHLAEKILHSRCALEGERKQVTVLFADLKGSIELLADRDPEEWRVEAQPELLAHHYAEAGLSAPAVHYWQRAGERAIQRSANVEAIAHLTTGLEVLNTLPETPERRRQELDLYIRLKGELPLMQPASGAGVRAFPMEPTAAEADPSALAEAKGCFQKALDVARHQEVKSFELRAAMSLSRLWQREGKSTEADGLLASVYGWFTEGFDTADLQEAKALLEEVS
jgi:hypothetical protein